MKRKTIRNFALATAIISLIFALIIFLYADGLRKWYSGGFFGLIGILMLVNAWRYSKIE